MISTRDGKHEDTVRRLVSENTRDQTLSPFTESTLWDSGGPAWLLSALTLGTSLSALTINTSVLLDELREVLQDELAL